jgi:hypothetical protein
MGGAEVSRTRRVLALHRPHAPSGKLVPLRLCAKLSAAVCREALRHLEGVSARVKSPANRAWEREENAPVWESIARATSHPRSMCAGGSDVWK